MSESNGDGLLLRAALHATKQRRELALRAAHAHTNERGDEPPDDVLDELDDNEGEEDE